jgi:hypothetical protein
MVFVRTVLAPNGKNIFMKKIEHISRVSRNPTRRFLFLPNGHCGKLLPYLSPNLSFSFRTAKRTAKPQRRSGIMNSASACGNRMLGCTKVTGEYFPRAASKPSRPRTISRDLLDTGGGLFRKNVLGHASRRFRMKDSGEGTDGAGPSAKPSQLGNISQRKLKSNRENARK